MLTIRRSQMSALSGHALAALVSAFAAGLRRQFPLQADALGDEPLRVLVEAAVLEAAALGVVQERGLRQFATLSLVFGTGFLDARAHAWMRGYLADPEVPDADRRVARLYAAVIARLEARARQDALRAGFDHALAALDSAGSRPAQAAAA
jgi:hypothetical protein